MNEVEFNIRLYLTGVMKSWSDRIDNTDQLTPQRFILSAMTELFDSLSEDEIEMIRLRYMKGLTLSEVASRYSISERTVRNHTNPTVKQVKEIIARAKKNEWIDRKEEIKCQ
ncbi:sigma factor-like helix-turn-helix DNA-binding protein [Lactococcus lactis]|uniref:sigma factor-like helix-turn-helix DNA-binding protein n=1 Tax=Lactococcus lactis TaxID=1358 RepID=UPI000E6C4C7A|nr:sigma factor-like helix-turn-helix DNA-binding protein [Lactococcus lactis]RJK90248.1 sigma-70 family RNA polymerase sigma factor [Lactococcus lactis subsp. lactis]